MRLRVLLLLAVAGILCASGVPYKPSTRAQSGATNVWIGNAAFVPNPIEPTGTSELKVEIATGSQVPATGADNATPIRAIVQASETSNLEDISYQFTPPSHVIKIPLSGGAMSSIGSFTLVANSENRKTGNIAYRVSLIGLENNQSPVVATTAITRDVTLSVTVPPPSPTPTPTPPATFEACQQQGWFWNHSEGTCTSQPSCQLMPEPCEPGSRWDFAWCQCIPNYGSPVVIDVAGDGFRMTDVVGGVNFDLNGDGLFRERVSWTAADSDDAFLFLDRNEDKIVNNGVELFGDVTPQPYSPTPNGFVALGFYDTNVHGGNGDGIIDSGDAAYSQLRLWQDRNHNGVSEPNELHTLAALGVASVSLDFKESKQKDGHGNLFKYRARVEPVRRAEAAKWAWDVFLLSQ